MPGRNGDRALLRSQPALESKDALQFLAGFKNSRLHAFNACVGAVDIHPDSIADQNPDHRMLTSLTEHSVDANRDEVAARNDPCGSPFVVQQLRGSNLAGAVSVAITRWQTRGPLLL